MNKKQEEYLIHCIAIAMVATCRSPLSKLPTIENEIKETYYRLGDKE